jgi:hypothetical protein
MSRSTTLPWTDRLTRQMTALALLLTFLLAPLAHAAVTPGEVTEADRLKFEQQKASAHMRELEERMYRLAETIREMEPDDSARLLLAVQRSRESLIVEQMHDVLTRLNDQNFAVATEQQAEVIKKLNELRDLLLSTNLDFELKLRQLKQVEAAMKKLDALVKEEEALQAESKDIEQQAEAQANKMAGNKMAQQATRAKTDALKSEVAKINKNTAEASKKIGEGAGKMQDAEGKMGEGEPGDAAGAQGEAAQALKDAKKQLEEEKKRLQEEIQAMAAKQIIAQLTDMLERQEKIRLATEALQPGATSGDREAVLGVQRLAEPELRLVEQAQITIDLINETGFSVALPPAVKNIQRQMIFVAAELKAGEADSETIGAEKRIESDLKELIDAMQKNDKRESEAKKEGGGQCQACGGNKNKLLSELKILRLLQVRVNEETRAVDAARRDKVARELGDDMVDRIGTVRDHEAAIADALVRLHENLCPDCLN